MLSLTQDIPPFAPAVVAPGMACTAVATTMPAFSLPQVIELNLVVWVGYLTDRNAGNAIKELEVRTRWSCSAPF